MTCHFIRFDLQCCMPLRGASLHLKGESSSIPQNETRVMQPECWDQSDTKCLAGQNNAADVLNIAGYRIEVPRVVCMTFVADDP